MDYSYFQTAPQPYFMGMPPNAFQPHSGVDPESMRGIVGARLTPHLHYHPLTAPS